MREDIVLKPIGIVLGEVEEPIDMPLGGLPAVVEVYPEYQKALKGIGENSHVWILSWFHKAPRDTLLTTPFKVNTDLAEFGVFALRSYGRPNPIGLSLAELIAIDGNRVYVKSLDAVGGTPVLDIKPYYENDIVFSPDTPYIKAKNREMRLKIMSRHARTHHRENCNDLHVAVRMAAIAEDNLGKVNSSEVSVFVEGSGCLADCLQGLTRGRIAAPPRFDYLISDEECGSKWKKGDQTLIIKAKKDFNPDDIMLLDDEALFHIELK